MKVLGGSACREASQQSSWRLPDRRASFCNWVCVCKQGLRNHVGTRVGRGELLAPAKGWGDFESPFQMQFIIRFCNLTFPGTRSGLALATVRYSALPPKTLVSNLTAAGTDWLRDLVYLPESSQQPHEVGAVIFALWMARPRPNVPSLIPGRTPRENRAG